MPRGRRYVSAVLALPDWAHSKLRKQALCRTFLRELSNQSSPNSVSTLFQCRILQASVENGRPWLCLLYVGQVDIAVQLFALLLQSSLVLGLLLVTVSLLGPLVQESLLICLEIRHIK